LRMDRGPEYIIIECDRHRITHFYEEKCPFRTGPGEFCRVCRFLRWKRSECFVF